MTFTLSFHHSKRHVLNKGFVKLIDCMPRQVTYECRKLACDSAVVQAARVSYSQGFKSLDTDTKLINYLYKNNHTSPFEMVKFKFHIKAPIFVARQWFRHRMSNYNEISGRYSVLGDELYYPDKIPTQSKINKQLSNDDDLSNNIKINDIFTRYMNGTEEQYKLYKELMNEGVSREIARIGLPLNLYTEFYWCIDLHNLLNFLNLRNSNYSQREIRQYAEIVEDIITPFCPITMNAKNINQKIILSKNQIKSINLNIDKLNIDNLNNKEKQELIKLFKF